MIEIVKDNQCLQDVALRVCGAVEGVWNLALRNGLSVTSSLQIGQAIAYQSDDVIDRRVVERYRQENIYPACELTKAQKEILYPEEGIAPQPPYEEIESDIPETENIGVKLFSNEFSASFA